LNLVEGSPLHQLPIEFSLTGIRFPASAKASVQLYAHGLHMDREQANRACEQAEYSRRFSQYVTEHFIITKVTTRYFPN